MRVFSKRYAEAIRSKKLTLSLPIRLRSRLCNLLDRHHFEIGKTSDTNWHYTVSGFDEVKDELLLHYGGDKLMARQNLNEPDSTLVEVDLKGFVRGTYPGQVLDVIQVFFELAPLDVQAPFQTAINEMFEDERCPWRLLNGQFFKVDSTFLDEHVVTQSHLLMKTEGFFGAMNEFEEARKDLASGDTKGAVVNAGLSLESTLKTILAKSSGNASELIRGLAGAGFWEDIPEHTRNAMAEQVMMCLPTIRNRLGGHGQGKDTVIVPTEYAELAVGLAAVFNQFLIKKQLKQKPKPEPLPAIQSAQTLSFSADEIPF